MTGRESYRYCTDEDILLRTPKDFALLCPRHQSLAVGSDGTFSPTARWTLRSASANFSSQGVVAGNVVRLLGPPNALRPSDDLLVIVTVGADFLDLRRVGQPPTVGSPPGPPNGLSGIEFTIPTLGPQIEAASREIARRFGIGESNTGGGPSKQRDLATLREATVLSVLLGRYIDLGRGSGGLDDPLHAKADVITEALSELFARSSISRSDGTPGIAIAFHQRLSR